jgi:DNA-binding NtrC family response regulator
LGAILVVGKNTLPPKIEGILGKQYRLLNASCKNSALSYLNRADIKAILSNFDSFGNSIELLKAIKQINQQLPVIFVSDVECVSNAVTAIKLGAAEFLLKTYDEKEFISRIQKSINSYTASKLIGDEQYDKFIYNSKLMYEIDNKISLFATTDADLLLLGETGTGKDLAAYEIHRRSCRRDKPFIQVSLHALSKSLLESEIFGHERGAFSGAEQAVIGKFEAANEGTLYFPEISELPEKIQLKLLYFFQYKRISRVGQKNGEEIKLNVRVILASNKKPEELIAAGKLREDFFFRFGIPLELPPLREREDDIDVLVNYFLNKYLLKLSKTNITIPPDLLYLMKHYNWKGNVRELKKLIEKGVLFTNSNEDMNIDSFPEFRQSTNNHQSQYKSAEFAFKRNYFTNLLKSTNGNKRKAAELAGITKQGLYKILHELEIF